MLTTAPCIDAVRVHECLLLNDVDAKPWSLPLVPFLSTPTSYREYTTCYLLTRHSAEVGYSRSGSLGRTFSVLSVSRPILILLSCPIGCDKVLQSCYQENASLMRRRILALYSQAEPIFRSRIRPEAQKSCDKFTSAGTDSDLRLLSSLRDWCSVLSWCHHTISSSKCQRCKDWAHVKPRTIIHFLK